MSLRDGLATHQTVAERYAHLVERGKIARDPAQEEIAAALDRLRERIDERRLARKSSALGWLFAKRRNHRAGVTGLYIHGGVGRGKTMLMDMFYEMLPVRGKRRAHFNDFMADVHDRIASHRAALKNGDTKEADPIAPVAAALAREAWVLCFDEFSVTDIADAMILSRLFQALFAEGVVLVATSNVAPDDLYRDGLNRGLFLPFIDILKQHTKVLHLDEGADYRLEKLNRLPVYITPLGAEADRLMNEAWEAIAAGKAAERQTIALKGRHIEIPMAAGSAARFSFDDLCRQPLGARDFLAIAKRYKTIFIDGIPVMAGAHRNEVKRFILLIDTLYDQRVRLIVSAEAPPAELYASTRGTEAFEFDRTASRLIEMQSRDWQHKTQEAGADETRQK
ncbi:cell division protein ZapE [Nitratireductor thuwali]|uniref:Cell division protein ZapE n=1 Tax=Nitratireductor thuwali TaxID=2267699 RepID=A0ABY5MJF7_9HYPH|nr:Cell division protein ZapE [Nitratireductor thuwali]